MTRSHSAGANTLDTTNTSVKWERLSDSVGTAFRLTSAEKRILRENPFARLIASLPFLADAEDPERTAVRNLGVYLLSVRGATEPYFDPRPADDGDVFRRLRLCVDMRTQRDDLVHKALAIIAYHMIRDYERDVAEDTAAGRYNPVAAGAIDANRLKQECLVTWKSVCCPEMDEILRDSPEAYWWD